MVDAETGKKNKAADKQGLSVFLKGKHKSLVDELMKEEVRPRWDYWRQSDKPVASPDSLWEAYIQDNNLMYVVGR